MERTPISTSIKNQRELITTILIGLIIPLVIDFRVNVPRQYSLTTIDSLVTDIFGALLGLTITSFAILIGMLPSLGVRLLETRAIRRLGRIFALTIFAELTTVVLGVFYMFSWNTYISRITSNAQVMFMFLSLSLIVLIFRYLTLLYNRIIDKTLSKS
jgi:hypothetical protein